MDFQRIWKREKDSFFKYKWYILFLLFVGVFLYSIKKTSHCYDLLQTIGLFVTIRGIFSVKDKTIEFHREFRSQDLRHRQSMLNSEQGRLEEEYSILAKEKKNEKDDGRKKEIEKEMDTIESKIDTIGNKKEENNILKNRLLIEAESK